MAVGDVHGDLSATRAVLRLAGAIDADGDWSGGSLVVVQTGDQLDRGDDEDEILALFERLRVQAEAAGGAFHALNGNHEFMNALGDFRYVTEEGFTDFAHPQGVDLSAPRWSEWPPGQRGRAAAFAPGGPSAALLARRNTVVIVGDTVFVHGGIRPDEAKDLDGLNAMTRSWLLGDPAKAEDAVDRIMRSDGVVWTRAYSEPVVAPPACAELERSLKALKVSRMVVGHTVQKGGIGSACDGKVWRIDVGLAKHYGGAPQALELRGAQVRVLSTHHGPGSRSPG